MSQALKQIDFAALIGVARSYVTKLKADGRLVLTADGRVDVDASCARIAETADPNRDDVASRWAAARGRETGLQAPPATGDPDEGEGESASRTYADARARKEHAQADIAEMERDQKRGQLIERAAVEGAFEDILTTLRQSLEQQPHRVAPMLVGLELDALRATLKQENHTVLSALVKDFAKSLQAIAGEGEGH